MARPGSKLRGSLPRGNAKAHSRFLTAARKAAKLGLVAGVEVLGCDDCGVSLRQKGVVYPIDHVPKLPIAGCVRSPFCACYYTVAIKKTR